jgi:hypothetical protein
MIDTERARAFVQTQGDEIQRLRLSALLDNKRPDAVPPALAALQNEDGGFALQLQPNRPSTLSSTAYALAWLRDLQLINSDAGQRALQFIEQQQTARGIWRESPDLQRFNPPPWMDPDSTAADVYTTAICASTLAVLGGDELAVDQAVAWLQTQQARDGLLVGFRAHSSWLALPAFVEIYGQETRTTRRLVAGLGSILDNSWPGSMLAWLLQCAADAGYTRRTELVDRAWEQLARAQQPDGSFTVDEGDDPIHTTLQALDVARRIGR